MLNGLIMLISDTAYKIYTIIDNVGSNINYMKITIFTCSWSKVILSEEFDGNKSSSSLFPPAMIEKSNHKIA